METLRITEITKKAYNNFIKRFMSSTGLPISQMQTLEEWLENRFKDYQDSSYAERFNGFDSYLIKKFA